MDLLTFANAGTQTPALSDLRTALSLKVCAVSETWSGIAELNTSPESAAVKVQAGLPKLQVVELVADWLRLVVPKTTLPAETTWALSVVLLEPEAMVKFAPEG